MAFGHFRSAFHCVLLSDVNQHAGTNTVNESDDGMWPPKPPNSEFIAPGSELYRLLNEPVVVEERPSEERSLAEHWAEVRYESAHFEDMSEEGRIFGSRAFARFDRKHVEGNRLWKEAHGQ